MSVGSTLTLDVFPHYPSLILREALWQNLELIIFASVTSHLALEIF